MRDEFIVYLGPRGGEGLAEKRSDGWPVNQTGGQQRVSFSHQMSQLLPHSPTSEVNALFSILDIIST